MDSQNRKYRQAVFLTYDNLKKKHFAQCVVDNCLLLNQIIDTKTNPMFPLTARTQVKLLWRYVLFDVLNHHCGRNTLELVLKWLLCVNFMYQSIVLNTVYVMS